MGGHMKDVTPEEFDRVFNINTRGQFFVAREAYKHLEVGGRIILMGSITGQAKGVPKHAVCKEYIPGGDKMNNDEVDVYAATWSPHNRVGQPIDIARVVAFLASQDGEWVNGKVIGIDGAACM